MDTTLSNPNVGPATAGTAGSALAGAGIYSVTEKVDLPAAASQTWALIRDFDGWQRWHPAFAGTEITQGQGNAPGAVRVLTTKDGARFVEELVAHDAGARRYRYRIIESPLPLVDYLSTLEVKEREGGSTVLWSSHFGLGAGASGDEIRRAIAGVYRAGLDNLASSLKPISRD